MGRLRAALFVTRNMTDAMVRQGTITRRRAASELAIALGLSFNDPELLHFSYMRYLENRIRSVFGFAGVRLRILARQRSSRDGA